LDRVKRAGLEAWIDRQLHPESIPDSPDLARQIAAMRTLHMTPIDLFVQYQLPVRQAPKDGRNAHQAARSAGPHYH
jgi:hypothetical protein